LAIFCANSTREHGMFRRQNTFTGRLTQAMVEDVLRRAAEVR
jgi:hypothetical protein